MKSVQFIQKIIENPDIPQEIRKEGEEIISHLKKQEIRSQFMISKLREDKRITENFLSKTVEELEEKNEHLSQTIEEKQKVNEVLIEAIKELEQFAYIISHDLQEPLRTILNFVSLLKQTKTDQLDDKARIYLDFISQSSVRMSQLIKAILEYSRIGKSEFQQEIDINQLVAEVLEDLNSIIVDKANQIVVEDLPIVSGFKGDIHSLFLNLITNSLKYSDQKKKGKIQIACEDQGDFWQFSIKDNGIGFDMRFKERIFIIFQRLNNAEGIEGSGIGLSRCKKIVELHSGKIWAESIPNQGSTFYFTLLKTLKNEKV